jgi:hypothetical protein
MARRSSRRSTRRNQRRQQERSFEALVYGGLVILFVLASLYSFINDMWVSIIGGCLLLFSGSYQSRRRWRVNSFTWLGGVLLLAVGLLALVNGQAIPGGMLLPIVVLGGVVLFSLLNGEL